MRVFDSGGQNRNLGSDEFAGLEHLNILGKTSARMVRLSLSSSSLWSRNIARLELAVRIYRRRRIGRVRRRRRRLEHPSTTTEHEIAAKHSHG